MMESSTSSPHPQPQPLKQYSPTDKKLIVLAMLTASCRERYEAASLKLNLALAVIRVKFVAPEHQDNFPKVLRDLLKKGRIPDDMLFRQAEFDDHAKPDPTKLETLVNDHASEASTKVVQYLTSCTTWKPLTDEQLEARKVQMDTITCSLSLILSFLMHPKAIAALTNRETLLVLFGPDRDSRRQLYNESAHPQDAVNEYETTHHALGIAQELEKAIDVEDIREYDRRLLENMVWINETTRNVLGVELDLMVLKLQERFDSIRI